MFVYAGIDIEREGLLTGACGWQVAGRLSMVRTGLLPRGMEWTALAAVLEASLRLRRHAPGTLANFDTYFPPADRRDDR